MSDSHMDRRPVRERGLGGTLLVLLGSAAAAVVLCYGYVFHVEPWLNEVIPEAPPGDPDLMSTPFIVPGIDRPAAVPADEADLDANTEVIGVVVGGKARAYVLAALRGPMHHVVNDVLGADPVTVTYSDRADCVRVFTGPAAGRPLDFGLGGW